MSRSTPFPPKLSRFDWRASCRQMGGRRRIALSLILCAVTQHGSSLFAQAVPADSSDKSGGTSWVPTSAGSVSSEPPKSDVDNDAARANDTVVPPPAPAPTVIQNTNAAAKVSQDPSNPPKTGWTSAVKSSSSEHYDPSRPDYNRVSSFASKIYSDGDSSFATKTFELPKDVLASPDDKRVGRPTGLANLDKAFPTNAFALDKGDSGDLFNKTYATSSNTDLNRPAKLKFSDVASTEFQGNYFKDQPVKAYPVSQYSSKTYNGPEAHQLEEELAMVQERLSHEKGLPTDHPLTIDDVRKLLNKDQKISGMEVAKAKLGESNSTDSSGNEMLNDTSGSQLPKK